MAEIDFDKMVQKVADAVAQQLKDDDLAIISRWIPVSDPLKELPRDRMLIVTVEPEDVVPYRYVTTVYYDMTEWSDEYAAKYATAYQNWPEPYKGGRSRC